MIAAALAGAAPSPDVLHDLPVVPPPELRSPPVDPRAPYTPTVVSLLDQGAGLMSQLKHFGPYNGTELPLRRAPRRPGPGPGSGDLHRAEHRQGGRDGGAAGVYVGPAPSASPGIQPAVRALRGFERVELAPGEARQISIALEPRSFQHRDSPSQSWKTAPGERRIWVGEGPGDLRLTGNVRVER